MSKIYIVVKDNQTMDRLFNNEQKAMETAIALRRQYPAAQIAISEAEVKLINPKHLPKLIEVPT